MITTVVAIVASLIAARGLFGLRLLAAPALLPAHDKLSDLWHAVWSRRLPGRPARSRPPWLGLVALGSTVLAGQPEWFSTAAAVRRGAARAADGVPGGSAG